MSFRNLLILGLAAGLFAQSASRLEPRTTPARPARPTMLPDYGRVPLSFERNEGQADPRVRYLSRGGGYTLFLTPSEAVLSIRGSAPGGQKSPANDPRERRDARSAVVRLKLVGANPAPQMTSSDELAG